MDYLFVIAVVFAVPLLILAIQQMTASNPESAMEMVLASTPDFTATQKVIGIDGRTGVAVDEGRRKLFLMEFSPRNSTSKTYSCDDLLSCEILEDGTIITDRSIPTQNFGSFKSQTDQEISRSGFVTHPNSISRPQRVKHVSLRITPKASGRAPHEITFMSMDSVRDGQCHVEALQKAARWRKLLASLISNEYQRKSRP